MEPIDILLNVKFKKTCNGAKIPTRKHDEDAGFDIYSMENVVLTPGEIRAIGTGISIAFPRGFKCELCPRSGMALKGFTIVNSPGTVDSGYRNEIKVISQNVHNTNPIEINIGDRIAQLIFVPIGNPIFEEVDELPKSVRGLKGFGSSGN